MTIHEDVFDLMDEWGPEKVVVVSDTKTGMKGCLVIDNTARGMGKGGTRMSPTVTLGEIARLARVMTWKWAASDLFYGGAKAGIVADPLDPRKEDILRAWARALLKHIPSEYVFGMDMGLAERDAAVVQDEIGDRGAAVGSPHELGGVPYDELGLTGYGVAESADAAYQSRGESLQGRSVAIQGFGAVGHSAAARCVELGATVVAVSTAVGTVYDTDGLDVAQLLSLRGEVGDDLVREYHGGEALALGEEVALPVDVLIPAARQDVISAEVARGLKAGLVVEGANLPTTPEAQTILKERGVLVVPDFIANAGAVVGAAVAMDARYSAFRPEPDGIFRLISEKLRANVDQVLAEAQRRDCTTHVAARTIAQERVHRAMELKGRIRQ